ncbi:MAG: CehA/McbA family metallohydrolase [candidate division Zixibacteria bacterium]|nr:CehA/McbA family metallohydrolase [candidate division Zixibacteria bacterium]
MFILDDRLILLLMFVPVLAYAETHYKFAFFPSRLFKKEPEIIIDLPIRLQPGANLPIVMIIKDSKQFPVVINSLSAEISSGEEKKIISLNLEPFNVNSYLFHKFFEIKNSELPLGEFLIDIKFTYSVNGKIKVRRNDNHIGTSHKSFRVYNSKDNWPVKSGWYAGDIHNHSDATDDFIEFGAPLEVYSRMALSTGIKWLAITDHSYDIDDEPEKYFAPDPELKRWKKLGSEVERLNKDSECIIIKGEEISCGNIDNRNIHLMGLNFDKFIPGFGDSGESWFHNSPNQNAHDVAKNILGQGGLPIAAHPGEKPLFLERMLLNRGYWDYKDLEDDNLEHLQVLNGRLSDSFYYGIEVWKKLLLRGKRKIIVAGSDAHGSFNRSRQISIPFLTMKESGQQLFGSSRTIAFLGDRQLSLSAILDSITSGKCVITNGPFIDLHLSDGEMNKYIIGERVNTAVNSKFELNAELISSSEFGEFKEFLIYMGVVGDKTEVEILRQVNFDSGPKITVKKVLAGCCPSLKTPCYFRAELKTGNDNICLTNPIWIDK